MDRVFPKPYLKRIYLSNIELVRKNRFDRFKIKNSEIRVCEIQIRGISLTLYSQRRQNLLIIQFKSQNRLQRFSQKKFDRGR